MKYQVLLLINSNFLICIIQLFFLIPLYNELGLFNKIRSNKIKSNHLKCLKLIILTSSLVNHITHKIYSQNKSLIL